MAQLMPLTVSCFSKIQIGFTFLVLVHPGSLRKKCRFLSSNLYYYSTTTPSVLQAAFQPVSQQQHVGIFKKKVADVGTGQMPLPRSNLQYQFLTINIIKLISTAETDIGTKMYN